MCVMRSVTPALFTAEMESPPPTIVVPRTDVLHTGLSIEEGIRVILSAGTATPSRLPRF